MLKLLKGTKELSNRRSSAKITLPDMRVCKAFFFKTLDMSNRQFTTMCTKVEIRYICKTDQRRKPSSANKINDVTRNMVI